MSLPSGSKSALVCGAVHSGADYLIPDAAVRLGSVEQITERAAKVGLQSAGADFVAGMYGAKVMELLARFSGGFISVDVLASMAKPLLSGGLYVAVDKFSKFDGTNYLREFLIQVGSSAGAQMLMAGMD